MEKRYNLQMVLKRLHNHRLIFFFNPCFVSYTEIKSKWIKDLNENGKSIRENVHDLKLGNKIP